MPGIWADGDFPCVESSRGKCGEAEEWKAKEGAEEAEGRDDSIEDSRMEVIGDTGGRGGGGGGRVGGGEDVRKEEVEEMVEKGRSLVEYASSGCNDSSLWRKSHWMGSEYRREFEDEDGYGCGESEMMTEREEQEEDRESEVSVGEGGECEGAAAECAMNDSCVCCSCGRCCRCCR